MNEWKKGYGSLDLLYLAIKSNKCMTKFIHLKHAGSFQKVNIIKRSRHRWPHHQNAMVTHKQHGFVSQLPCSAHAFIFINTEPAVVAVIRHTVVEDARVLVVHPEPRVLQQVCWFQENLHTNLKLIFGSRLKQ